MPDLLVRLTEHGLDNDDPIYASWLDDIFFVADKNANAFKLSVTEGGTTFIQFEEEISDAWIRQVDATSGIVVITDLDHLEGESVRVTSNGSLQGSFLVSDGSVTVPNIVFTYQVGLPYTCSVRTMRLEIPGAPTIQSRVKTISEVVIRHSSTQGGEAGQELRQNKKSTELTKFTSKLNAIFSKKSFDIAVPVKGGSSEEGYIVIESATPEPMTTIAAIISFDVKERR